MTMKNKNKKMELAQKNNTRIVYCNTAETQVLLELVNSVDMLYKHIRKNAGVNIPSSNANEYITQFMFVANSIENFLLDVSSQLKVQNLVKRSFILQKAEELNNSKEDKK